MTTILKVTTDNELKFLLDELINIEAGNEEQLRVVILGYKPSYVFNLVIDNLICDYNYTTKEIKYGDLTISIHSYDHYEMSMLGKEYDCAFISGTTPARHILYVLSRIKGDSKFGKRCYMLNNYN